MVTARLTKKVEFSSTSAVVLTEAGSVRGVEKEGRFIFRGIPYAEADRFEMPKKITPWEGVRAANIPGPACPQEEYHFNPDEPVNPHYFLPMNEDCQYLNIWTGSIDPKAKKPVMFWIHGGGWMTGSSMELFCYDGEDLSQFGDCVVVSVGHRLNCLGYLDLSAFGEKYKFSNMVGLADLVAALTWVHENIGAFGGDPENVMIFGQSGGGSKVLYLMQTPAADGLYHKAAVESGGAMYGLPTEKMTKKQIAQRVGILTAKILGLDESNIDEIKSVPYRKLKAAADAAAEKVAEETGIKKYRFEPIGDGEYCMGSPYLNDFRKETLSIPLIMGSTFGEHDTNLGLAMGGRKNELTAEEERAVIYAKFGEKTDDVIESFKSVFPEKRAVDVCYLDSFDRKQIRDLTRKRVNAGGKTWNYLFAFESPYNGGTCAWHCSEIAFVFHNAHCIEGLYIPEVTERLEDQISGAWVSLLKNGDPNHEGLPFWPESTKDCINTMVFEEESHVNPHHDDELWEIFPWKNKLK